MKTQLCLLTLALVAILAACSVSASCAPTNFAAE